MKKLLLVSVVALSVGGCAGMSQRETNGALLGGGAGAVVGGVIRIRLAERWSAALSARWRAQRSPT